MKNPASMLPTATPAWCETTPDESVGVDYIGTRAANLALLRQLTGIYNNQVVSARQHAILAWAAWRFHENAKNRDAVTRSEFEAFLNAVETVQLVGQGAVGAAMGGTSGGLGSGSASRLPTGGLIPLQFATYRRTHATSAIAAVQYGPSAKAEGLGFLNTAKQVLVATERGVRLAKALDPLFRQASAYAEFTREQPPTSIEHGAAVELARNGLVICGRDGVPRPEREPYIDALFSFDGQPSRDLRSHTMALLLHWFERLDDEEGVDPHDVRVRLLAAAPQDPHLPPCLIDAARKWQVFYIRQHQRFVLEALLGLAERWMHRGIRTVQEMLEEFDGVCEGELGVVWNGTAGDATRHVQQPLAWAASRKPWALAWEEIYPALHQHDAATAARGTVELLLGVLALIDRAVPTMGPLHTYASTGGRTRISLVAFRSWWHRRRAWPLREVLGELIEEFVLQQHVAIAVSRFDNEARRLRFSNGEAGWELLGTTPSTPTMTADRLNAAAALLNDLALLEPRDHGRFCISAEGRRVLARFTEAL